MGLQDDKQVKKRGADKVSWYVGWIDPEGKRRCKSCGPGSDGHRNAEKLRKKREAELIEGTYQSNVKKTWDDFREEYEARIAEGMEPQTRRITLDAFGHFERIISPKRIAAIKTRTVDEYVARRRTEAGRRVGDVISPATVNKELRHLRAVLRVAHKWGYLPAVPKFRMLREPKHLPTFVTPEHFAAIYQACDIARMPEGFPFTPGDWWRGLLITAYMTGWRIGELLALRREDLDLEGGYATTWAEDNKGKRDEKVKLHPVVVEHLGKLAHFQPCALPWNHHLRTLYDVSARVQEAAGIHLPCREQHEHTRFCHVYGFHDKRRAFATMNADRMSADALQKLMRHKSYLTTQKYLNMARQMDEAVEALHVPEVARKGMG